MTGKSLGHSKLLDRVTNTLGSRCAHVFAGVSQHVPAQSVRALTETLRRVDADVAVSFGGGSPIDATKVAIASILNDRDLTLEGRELDWASAVAPRDSKTALIHIAIPTTLSAAEYTPAGGVTNEETHIKRGVIDARLQPAIIINDPELTVGTPDWLWISTGMRALDHAIEAIYSIRHQAFTDALAVKAIELLIAHLPPSVRTKGAESLIHRGQCQTGAWLSLYGMINVGLGISHALGHQIGPTWNVPHGVTSCITLPHAMRFMAELAPHRFEHIAAALRISFDADNPTASALRCADRVAQFIGQFDVPQSLRAVGVARADAARIVDSIFEEINFAAVIERRVTRAEIAELLDKAYG